jgi:probable addiction module antidote protein
MNNKNTGTLDELVLSGLKTQDDIKEWLNVSLDEYLQDNDFASFFKALEYAVKAQDTISGISKKTGISRSNLYAIFKGEIKPQLGTVLRIIKELGYTIKIA